MAGALSSLVTLLESLIHKTTNSMQSMRHWGYNLCPAPIVAALPVGGLDINAWLEPALEAGPGPGEEEQVLEGVWPVPSCQSLASSGLQRTHGPSMYQLTVLSLENYRPGSFCPEPWPTEHQTQRCVCNRWRGRGSMWRGKKESRECHCLKEGHRWATRAAVGPCLWS